MISLVVGAGAVKDAWVPVVRAIQPYFDFDLTNDSANSYLTRIVYLCRWWEMSTGKTENKSSDDPRLDRAKVLQLHKKELSKLKQDISIEIEASLKRNEISAREEFEEVFTKFVLFKSKEFALINTNWDTAIDYAAKRIIAKHGASDLKVVHLHGHYKDLPHMYLPSEITEEPYRKFDDNQQIGFLHGAVWRTLEISEAIVLYGLSLSPLDVELCQTLACGFNSKILKRIIVIDPDHKLIASRVNLLIDFRYPVCVFGCSPSDLENLSDYSIDRKLLIERNEMFVNSDF